MTKAPTYRPGVPGHRCCNWNALGFISNSGVPVAPAATHWKDSHASSGAGSDPRGHLWVTWGVYLWAGKPPLADIILSHPPDLT